MSRINLTAYDLHLFDEQVCERIGIIRESDQGEEGYLVVRYNFRTDEHLAVVVDTYEKAMLIVTTYLSNVESTRYAA